MSPVSGTRLQSLPFLRNEGQLLKMKDSEDMWKPHIWSFKVMRLYNLYRIIIFSTNLAIYDI